MEQAHVAGFRGGDIAGDTLGCFTLCSLRSDLTTASSQELTRIQFTHLLIHLVITTHQGCITTFVGCRYFAFVSSFLYKSTLKIILHDCVSMIMTTIQAGFIIIYKLSQHFPSHLKQIQTKRTYLEKQTYGYQSGKGRGGVNWK